MPRNPFTFKNNKACNESNKENESSWTNTSIKVSEQTEATVPKNYQNNYIEKRKKIIEKYSKIHYKYKLKWQTLYLAVNLIDKSWYLGKQEELSIRALACLNIAMKYEEIYPPRLNDIMYVFSNTFLSNKAVVLAEVAILKNVNFVIHMEYPTTILNKKVNIPEDKRAEILYNLEIALNNEEISKNYEWSIIVEAIVFMMSPLTERLDKKRKDQDKILKVNKKLILEKDNIDVNSWLYKKHKNFGKYYVV